MIDGHIISYSGTLDELKEAEVDHSFDGWMMYSKWPVEVGRQRLRTEPNGEI